MKKIKVLHLIKNLGLGGAEVNLLHLAQGMESARFELHIAYLKGGELESRFRKGGLRLLKLSDRDHKVKSPMSIIIVLKIMYYVWRHGIHIIHTNNSSSHFWGVCAAKITRRKLVEHVHDFRYLEPQEFKRRRGFCRQYKYIRLMKNMSDQVIVLTKQNRQFLLRHGYYPACRVREIQNGVSFGRTTEHPTISQMKEKFGLPKTHSIVLTPARIAPEKNIDLILDIAPQVVQRIPNVLFLIAGDGPLLEELKHKAHERKISDHVRFIGFQPDMENLLKLSDIFLLPSFLELHSIALLEALEKKVPVVISKGVGCHDEYFTSWKDCVLLDPFTHEGWAEALLTLIHDSRLRQRIGRKGHELFQRQFNMSNTVQQLSDIYVDLARS